LDLLSPRWVAATDVLFHQQAADRPDVVVGSLERRSRTVDTHVPGLWRAGLDAQRYSRVVLDLTAPDACGRAGEPERVFVPQPPHRHRVRPAVTSKRGDHADVGLL